MKNSNSISKFIEVFILALCSPFFLLGFMPYAWSVTLWQSRTLLWGRWYWYLGFHPKNALNNFFYRTQWLNLDRIGRMEKSSCIGTGDYELANWFHLCLFSSCLGACGGAFTTAFGSILWVGTHLAWILSTSWQWVLVVTLCLFLSSTAYAMAFARQNYNIVGWLLFPICLWSMMNSHWGWAALAWVIVSFCSVTCCFIGFWIAVLISFQCGSVIPVAALLPALAKLSVNALPMLIKSHAMRNVANFAKLLGFQKRGVRYSRESMRVNLLDTYIFLVYLIGIGGMYWATGIIPDLPLFIWMLFMINQHLFRFADDQSMIVSFVSVGAAWVMQHAPFNWVALLFFWLTAAPLPVYLGLTTWHDGARTVRFLPLSPFSHQTIEKDIRRFLAPVESGNRILFSFSDPQGVYDRIFDGYRNLCELPLWVAATRDIHLMPDWHFIAETNYPNSPDVWGRSVKEVQNNLQKWNAKFAIIYQQDSKELEEKWKEAFTILGEFDWENPAYGLTQVHKHWQQKLPKWWLVRQNDS